MSSTVFSRGTLAARLGIAGAAALLPLSLLPISAQAETGDEAHRPASPGRVVVFGAADAAVGLPADLDAVAIAASDSDGARSSLAIKADGTVVGWGANTYGEATPPAGLRDVTDIDVTAGLGVALTKGGQVVAWGDNRSGGLDVPADLGEVVDVAVGGSVTGDGPCNFALAVTEDGRVVRWGEDDPAKPCFDMSLDAPEDLDNAVTVAANGRGAMALRADGTVATWGRWFSTRWDGVNPAQWSGVEQISMSAFTALGRGTDNSIAQYGIWGESGPGLTGPATTVSAGLPDLWLDAEGAIKAYRTATVPTGTGYQAVAAGIGYGVAIAAAEDHSGGGETPDEPPALGSDEIQEWLDSNPAGMAEAFQYTATADLRARTMSVYVDQRSTARTVIVGVYTNRRGEPGQLIGTGRTRKVTEGAWNDITISRVDVEAGQKYWLAVLTPKRRGTLYFRDLPDGHGGPTVTSAATDLTGRAGLPIKWRTGRHYGNAPASMYLR